MNTLQQEWSFPGQGQLTVFDPHFQAGGRPVSNESNKEQGEEPVITIWNRLEHFVC